MAMTATLVKRTKSPQGLVGIFTLVASGSYSTGGDSVDFAPKIGYTNKQPSSVLIKGIAGYEYEYVLSTKKVIVRQGAVAGSIVGTFAGTALTGTFTGTALTGTFTGTAIADHSHALHLKNADVAYATTAAIMAETNKLGANTGSDIEVAGITTTSGSGGILAAGGTTPTGVVAVSTPTGTVAVSTPTGTVTAALSGTAAPGGQLPATTYPSGVTGDTISAIVSWTI